MKRLFFYIFILFIASACEKTGTDQTPVIDNDPNGLVKNGQSIYYTWQGNDIAVDIRSFQNLSNISVINIVEQPLYGAAKFENNFMHYLPDAMIIEAEDQVVLEIKNKDNTTSKEIVYIKIKENPLDIPCHTGALPDKFEIETNKNKILDVLSNDMFCDAALTVGSLKLAIEPKNGKANILSDKISYTPSLGFKGEDQMVYEFLAKNNDGKEFRRITSVLLKVEDKNNTSSGCILKLVNDFFSVPVSSNWDSILIKPLKNDETCKQGLPIKMSISEAPKNGIAKVLNDTTILYKFSKNNIGGSPIIDEIEYRVAQGNDIKVAKIQLKASSPPNNCKTILNNYNVTISISKPSYEFASAMSKGVLELDMLKSGSQYCAPLKSVTIVDAAKNEKVSFVPFGGINGFGKFRYEPENGKFVKGELKFSYKVIDSKGVENTAKISVKFVD